MKQIIFILMLGLAPWASFSQNTPPLPDTVASDSPGQDAGADSGEAGGIDAAEIADNNKDAMNGLWIGLICGTLGAIVGSVITYSIKKKSAKEAPDSKLFIDERVAEIAPDDKANTADLRKLKSEIRALKQKLDTANNEAATYKKNLDIYADFDQKYYNEAFRKLIAPMNDAMERGSRREILENLLKIMSHFASLTRYKIAKKQAYDEPNMQYLLNQKMKNDVAVEIDGNTPVDKIPKNIKPLIDMLAEQSSSGLDDTIISGYKIKNL